MLPSQLIGMVAGPVAASAVMGLGSAQSAFEEAIKDGATQGKALTYGVLIGAPFVSFKEYYVEREIFDYIRSMRTGFTVQSLAEYAKLRKAMAVWDKYDRSYAETAIEAVATELGETADDTKGIVLGGLLNENRVDLYQQYAEDDEA